MSGQFCATVGDREFSVSVNDSDSRCCIQVGDTTFWVDAVQVKPGTWSLLLNGRSIIVDVDESREPSQFHTHAAVTPIVLESAQRKRLFSKIGQRKGASKKGEQIKALIAGRIVKLNVKVGDVVESGSCVAILEAMKMENEIKCTRAGTVVSVDVSVGDSVNTGAAMLSLRPIDAG